CGGMCRRRSRPPAVAWRWRTTQTTALLWPRDSTPATHSDLWRTGSSRRINRGLGCLTAQSDFVRGVFVIDLLKEVVGRGLVVSRSAADACLDPSLRIDQNEV